MSILVAMATTNIQPIQMQKAHDEQMHGWDGFLHGLEAATGGRTLEEQNMWGPEELQQGSKQGSLRYRVGHVNGTLPERRPSQLSRIFRA
jgi:hypothetical protein